MLTANDYHVEQLIQLYPWLQSLSENAPLPKKYRFKSHHTLALLFSLYCSGAGSFLYIKGGEEKNDKMAIIGGVGVNLTQNLLYSMSTYFFIQDAISHFKQSWGRLTTASVLATIATAPSTISAYKLSHGNLGLTLLSASGNLPGNIFGMFTSLNAIWDATNNNRKVRLFLLDRLKETLDDPRLQQIIHTEYNRLTHITGGLLGMGVGIGLASAQIGYVCSSCDFGADLIGPGAGITLGIIANTPSLAIALLVSGMELGKLTAHSFVDLCHVIDGTREVSLSTREKLFLATYLALLGASSYLAYYSNATSEVLYEQNCPSFGNAANEVLDFSVTWLTSVFNGIMSGFAINAGLNYIKKAYVDPTSHDGETYRVEAMAKWIKNAPTHAVEAFAETHFPTEKPLWQKPVSEHKKSCWPFFKSKKPSGDHYYLPLTKDDRLESRKSACGIM